MAGRASQASWAPEITRSIPVTIRRLTGLGRELQVSARSTDGVIEGLELGSAPFVVAVQWHPEDRIEISSADRKLFEAFAAAVREQAKL